MDDQFFFVMWPYMQAQSIIRLCTDVPPIYMQAQSSYQYSLMPRRDYYQS